jgi:hypothetical protein
MHIYSIANVENLKLYGPSILDQENEQILPTIEEVPPKFQEELEEDTFFHKNHKTTRKGQHGLWQIGLKGQLPSKAKWYSGEKVEENFADIIQ